MKSIKRIGQVDYRISVSALKKLMALSLVAGIVLGMLIFLSLSFLSNTWSFNEASKTGLTIIADGQIIEVKSGSTIEGNAFEYIETDNGKTSTTILKTPFKVSKTMNIKTNTIAVIYYGEISFEEQKTIDKILD